MGTIFAAGFLTAVHAVAVVHGHSVQGGSQLELWQVINLLGTPLLAMMFLPPVIEDLVRWNRARREAEVRVPRQTRRR